VSGFLTAVKVVGVFGLLAVTLIYLRRHDKGRLRVARKSNRPVVVLGQARLSKAASVAVVDIGGTAYAVAVTDQRVSLLLPDPVELPEAFAAPVTDTTDTAATADLDAAPARTAGTGSGRPSFGEALAQQVRVLTRRESPVSGHELTAAILPQQADAPTADGTALATSARMPGTSPG
jgi:flagellar biogenesis protein FliO